MRRGIALLEIKAMYVIYTVTFMLHHCQIPRGVVKYRKASLSPPNSIHRLIQPVTLNNRWLYLKYDVPRYRVDYDEASIG